MAETENDPAVEVPTNPTTDQPLDLTPEVISVHKAYGSFSAPYLVTGSDKKQYVLKQGSGNADLKLIAGEYLGVKIGARINAPVVDCGLIRVEPDAVELFEKCPNRGNALIPEPGLYFASHHQNGYTGNEILGLPDMQINADRPLRNVSGAAGAILFETWLDNTDEHQGNILYVPVDDVVGKGIEVLIIDLGHIFGGPGWNSLNNPAGITLRVTRSGYFSVAADKMLDNLPNFEMDMCSINVMDITNIASEIPVKWGLTDVERDQIAIFLTNRASSVYDSVKKYLILKGGVTP